MELYTQLVVILIDMFFCSVGSLVVKTGVVARNDRKEY